MVQTNQSQVSLPAAEVFKRLAQNHQQLRTQNH